MNPSLPRPALALPPSFSTREFRNALGMFATGVTIVTARNAAGELVEQEFKGRVRWTEVESLDTRNNATRSAVLLKAAGIERIALVTHGWHMVRAARDFEQAGLQVLPAPMGFKGGQARKLYRVLPRASALSDSSLALHEWLGILAQRASLDR